MSDSLTLTAAAAFLKVHRTAVYRKWKEGQLPRLPDGRYPLEPLRAWKLEREARARAILAPPEERLP